MRPVTRSVGAFEAKTHLAALLDAVASGEQITITRHGRPVARLVPPDDQARPDGAGSIERLRAFNAGPSLGWLSWHELRDQGRP
jgi:prevent-host-death family protein